MITVALVDDQRLVRTGLHRILAEEEGFRVVAECSDGVEALSVLATTTVDVVLMDIRMRVMDGIEATRRLREVDGPPVLVLTTFDDDDVLAGALEAGAAGFVLKEASAEQLIEATRAVAAGGAWIDPAVLPRVLAGYRSTILPRLREQAKVAQLTGRELEVLREMATGASNGDRRPTCRERGHRQESRRQHLQQARRARSCGGDRLRLPARPRLRLSSSIRRRIRRLHHGPMSSASRFRTVDPTERTGGAHGDGNDRRGARPLQDL